MPQRRAGRREAGFDASLTSVDRLSVRVPSATHSLLAASFYLQDFNLATSASSWRQRGRRHLCRVSLREVSILRGAPMQLPSGSPWAAGHARTGGEASHADGGPGEAIRPLLALGVGGVPARQSGDRARSLA